ACEPRGEGHARATPLGVGNERRLSEARTLARRRPRRVVRIGRVGIDTPRQVVASRLVGEPAAYQAQREWKRCGSGKPQQSAAALFGSSLAERAERQTAVRRSTCSRLTSKRSPVRAGHRPFLIPPKGRGDRHLDRWAAGADGPHVSIAGRRLPVPVSLDAIPSLTKARVW
ncbi:MAG: hypothetical protein K0R41_3517, partial [Geminicoccaceae bacterium]|nr:hypothetical protein [Geminicoccaceae bacterium]